MQELIDFLDPIHTSVKDKANELLLKEEKQIKDAMLHALDEDGHTGEWKIKFVNHYYSKIFDKI